MNHLFRLTRRCDAVPFLFEVKKNADGLYDDEPLSGDCVDDPEVIEFFTRNEFFIKNNKIVEIN